MSATAPPPRRDRDGPRDRRGTEPVAGLPAVEDWRGGGETDAAVGLPARSPAVESGAEPTSRGASR